MSSPGFELGLSRPQRHVLAARRRRRHTQDAKERGIIRRYYRIIMLKESRNA